MIVLLLGGVTWETPKGNCPHWVERHKADYEPTFTTANDVRLLTNKMVEKGIVESLNVDDISCFSGYIFSNSGRDDTDMLALWFVMSPTEQATKIHAFLKEVGEIL